MGESERIRLLIVDDHALVRYGLRHYLSAYDWIEAVGEAGNGWEAVEYCANEDVDVVLMDLVMPGMDGREATRRIKAQNKAIEIIILTSFHEGNMVEEALQAGAIGYILKNVTADELANAIRSAATGRSTLSPEATDALISATRRHTDVGFNLTPREFETLEFVVMGLSNDEIAERLFVSNRTVTFHLTNIFTKLGVRNRVEAVTTAIEHGLVDRSV